MRSKIRRHDMITYLQTSACVSSFITGCSFPLNFSSNSSSVCKTMFNKSKKYDGVYCLDPSSNAFTKMIRTSCVNSDLCFIFLLEHKHNVRVRSVTLLLFTRRQFVRKIKPCLRFHIEGEKFRFYFQYKVLVPDELVERC